MTQHTPGPWQDRRASSKTWHNGIYDQFGNEVALIKVKSALTLARRDADARLIASAPDLLAALEDCAEALEHLQNVMHVRVNPPTLETARAALKLAKGR